MLPLKKTQQQQPNLSKHAKCQLPAMAGKRKWLKQGQHNSTGILYEGIAYNSSISSRLRPAMALG